MSTQALEIRSEDLSSQARALVIASAEDANRAAALTKTLRGLISDIESYWNDKDTGPCATTHRAWKATVEKRDAMLAGPKAADALVSKAIVGWDAKCLEERRREQERLDAEARVKREAEIAAALAAAKEAGAKKPELRTLERQMESTPLAVQVAARVEKPAGISVPKRWKASLIGATEQQELQSLERLIKAAAKNPAFCVLLKFNESAANALAIATKGTLDVPGVRFHEEPYVTRR